MSSIAFIQQDDPRYPRSLSEHLGHSAPAELSALGNFDILQKKTLALFCSVKCPGDLILKTYDLAQQLRECEETVTGGFHSPMERECGTILLRGNQPLIVCPARTLENMRLPFAFKKLWSWHAEEPTGWSFSDRHFCEPCRTFWQDKSTLSSNPPVGENALHPPVRSQYKSSGAVPLDSVPSF